MSLLASLRRAFMVTVPCEIRQQGAVMAKKAVRSPTTRSPKPSRMDGDGNHIHNHILNGLPPAERKMLSPKLEFVRLKVHQLLHEAGDTLKSAYFCNSGMVSILSVF